MENDKKVNNPNAFPTDLETQKQIEAGYAYQTGMTLLDYFAAKAMLRTKPQIFMGKKETEESFKEAAEYAYTYASAMLKEREKHI